MRERHIKDLLALCLMKWKTLLTGILIAAVLVGAYQVGVQVKRKNDAYYSVEFIEDEYEAQMQDYKKEIAPLDVMIGENERKLEALERYCHDSVMMNANPYSMYATIIDVTIAITDEETLPDLYEYNVLSVEYVEDKILSQYYAAFSNYNLNQNSVFNGLYDSLERKYWNEFLILSRKTGGILEILAKSNDKKASQVMAEEVLRCLEEMTASVAAASFKHELVVLCSSEREEVDAELDDYQLNKYNQVEELKKTILSLQEERDEINVPVKRLAFSVSEMIKGVIKFTALGGMLGFIISMFGIMISCILNQSFITSHEVEENCQLAFLGTIGGSRRVSLANKVTAERVWTDKAVSVEYAVQAIKKEVQAGEQTIMFVSTQNVGDNNSLLILDSKVKDNYSTSIVEDALHNPEFISGLKENVSVVLVEQLKKSKYQEVCDIVNSCKRNHVVMLGFILVD